MTLADLSVGQLTRVLAHSAHLKKISRPLLRPNPLGAGLPIPPQSLTHKTIGLYFSKRSTRTRVSAETATDLLGGNALFLGKEDIQLGVNESIRDTSNVLGGMIQGIFARVGEHSEIEVGKHTFVIMMRLTFFHVVLGNGQALPCACHQRTFIAVASYADPC